MTRKIHNDLSEKNREESGYAKFGGLLVEIVAKEKNKEKTIKLQIEMKID